MVLLVPNSSHRAFARVAPEASPAPLPLPRGAAWFSQTLDTSAATVANGRLKPQRELLQKWVTWQGDEFAREGPAGSKPYLGSYSTGDSEPGFGDWDALDVHTLPNTAAGVLRLLESGRLEVGQSDRAERTSPLIWLAQLAAMLADDPNTPASRAAAVGAIEGFPGLQRLGQVRDPQGRLGAAVAEVASNLHPLLIAAGKGCRSPYGGAGCVTAAQPNGRYELEMIFDPSDDAVLAVRTVALSAIPAAWIKAGTAIYQVSYLQGRLVTRPRIPPPPRALPPTIESVPWHLARVRGRRLTIRWDSGTCDPSLRPKPRIRVVETKHTITLTVLVHVVKARGSSICVGVGLGGTLSTTLAHPVGNRKIAHGKVTDDGG
jgi:hypothetical protein